MGRGSSRPSGRKEGGEENYSFLFQIFLQNKFEMQFQLNSKSDFNQEIQNSMQWHVCTFMVVNLYLILFLIKLLFPEFKYP